MSKKDIIIRSLTDTIKRFNHNKENSLAYQRVLEDRIGALNQTNQELRDTNSRLTMELSAAQRSSTAFEDLSLLLDKELRQKNKITAIKVVRKVTKCGLKEAKEFVESFD